MDNIVLLIFGGIILMMIISQAFFFLIRRYSIRMFNPATAATHSINKFWVLLALSIVIPLIIMGIFFVILFSGTTNFNQMVDTPAQIRRGQ